MIADHTSFAIRLERHLKIRCRADAATENSPQCYLVPRIIQKVQNLRKNAGTTYRKAKNSDRLMRTDGVAAEINLLSEEKKVRSPH